MAQVDCPYNPTYSEEQLRFQLLRGSFADKPHAVHLVYDEIMDQLFIRLVDPRVFASEFYIEDDLALLVRDSDQEVIGFAIANFQAEFLPKASKLNTLWHQHKLAERFQEYQKIEYQPESRNRKPSGEVPEQRIVAYSVYRSKAAAALVMA